MFKSFDESYEQIPDTFQSTTKNAGCPWQLFSNALLDLKAILWCYSIFWRRQLSNCTSCLHVVCKVTKHNGRMQQTLHLQCFWKGCHGITRNIRNHAFAQSGILLSSNPKFKGVTALCKSEREQVTGLTKDSLQTFKMPVCVQRSDHTCAPHLQKFHDNEASTMGGIPSATSGGDRAGKCKSMEFEDSEIDLLKRWLTAAMKVKFPQNELHCPVCDLHPSNQLKSFQLLWKRHYKKTLTTVDILLVPNSKFR